MKNKSEKKVVLLRAIDMLPDPRVEKYVTFYKEKSISYSLVGWNRSDKKQEKENTIFFKKPAPFGAGDANAKSLLQFNKFIFSYLRKNRKNYTTIHACDLDTIMPALLIKLLYGKRVIFDVFDWYSHSRNIGSKLFSTAIKICEWFAIKLSNAVIICDSERRSQIPYRLKDSKLMVLPNVPSYDSAIAPLGKPKDPRYSLHISYVGIFGTSRGLEDMLEVVSTMPNICFTLGGFGELTSIVESYANKYDNIKHLGKLSYSDSLQTMAGSDLICAMYYTDIVNHIYAAPNKFYEGLYLGIPILTTVGTIPGTKCEKDHFGFAIGEGAAAISDFLNGFDMSELVKRGQNARSAWDLTYSSIWAKTINGQYFDSL